MFPSLRHFRPAEFACRCGQCDGGAERMDTDLLTLLDRARERAGVPFPITSGYRCPAHNRAVGGVADSSHVYGFAVDIAARDSRTRFLIVSALLDLGAYRIGVAGSFVHVDVDDTKPRDVMWTY